jgi:predicted O-methyltransferase YrrM
VQIVTGNFDNTLPEIAGMLPQVDLAFIDGNHRRIPTVKYFHALLEKCSDNSVVVFDDIHWSKGMELAWEEVKSHPSVMLTIDLFFMGLVFFRPEFKVKQHFTIRF